VAHIRPVQFVRTCGFTQRRRAPWATTIERTKAAIAERQKFSTLLKMPSRSGSASVITTHALFARKVQRKLRNGVAGFAAGGSSSDRKRSRPIRAFSATPHDGQRQRRTLAEDPGRTQFRAAYPQRRSSNANGLRGQNSAGFPQISPRLFKGIICDDISELESHRPSHAVGSLPANL